VSYFRRLEGYTPPERITVHWLSARIEEASSPTATPADITGPITLVPSITDPENPPSYDFETANAVLAEGWYRVVWIDAGGQEQPTEWLQLRALSPYAPTVGDIAAILRARTVELGGVRVNTFTDRTTPTAQQVQDIIALHTPLVFATLGPLGSLACTNASDLLAGARSLAAQYIALEVEASYWAEELGDSPTLDIRRTMLDTATTTLSKRVEECRGAPAGGDGGDSVSRSDPAYTFPVWQRMVF
jgi:hypothetical protein